MTDNSSAYLNLTAGVTLPLCQSLVNGTLVGVCCGGLAAMSKHIGWFDLPPIPVSMSTFAVAALIEWRSLIDDWRGFLYGPQYLEEDPAPESVHLPPVRVELAENQGRSMSYIDLPAEPEQLIALGSGLVQGAGFTEAGWTGSGNPFSRSQFVALRDAMIRRGLAAWNSQNDTARGVRVTGKGMAIMRHFASLAAGHPPTLQRSRNP